MTTKFMPAIDINAIINSVQPEMKARKAKAEKTATGDKVNSHRSNKSGFPTMRGLHEYLLAINPAIAFNQATLVMDAEYPFVTVNKAGEICAADAKGAKRVRVNEDGSLMKTENGLVSRAYKPAHLSYYKKTILGNSKWTLGEEFGITDEMKKKAEEAYEAIKETTVEDEE